MFAPFRPLGGLTAAADPAAAAAAAADAAAAAADDDNDNDVQDSVWLVPCRCMADRR